MSTLRMAQYGVGHGHAAGKGRAMVASPDVELARVFGMPGVRAEGADALAGALREAQAHDGPVLIEVPVGPMPMFLRNIRERLSQRLAAAGVSR